jgi:hypothetical protein
MQICFSEKTIHPPRLLFIFSGARLIRAGSFHNEMSWM